MSPESSALEADSLPVSHRESPDKFKVHSKIEWEVQKVLTDRAFHFNKT